jgi:hypothetical protein
MILIKFKDTVAPAVIIFLFCAHFSGVKTQDIQKGGGVTGNKLHHETLHELYSLC